MIGFGFGAFCSLFSRKFVWQIPGDSAIIPRNFFLLFFLAELNARKNHLRRKRIVCDNYYSRGGISLFSLYRNVNARLPVQYPCNTRALFFQYALIYYLIIFLPGYLGKLHGRDMFTRWACAIDCCYFFVFHGPLWHNWNGNRQRFTILRFIYSRSFCAMYYFLRYVSKTSHEMVWFGR